MNYILPFWGLTLILFVALVFNSSNSVFASEITGNLSSAGSNRINSNSGIISGNVVNPTLNSVVSVPVSGGGGGIIIDLAYTHEPGYLNSGTQNILPSTNSTNNKVAYTYKPSTYVSLKVFDYSGNSEAYTSNENRRLAFGGEDQFSSATMTQVLAQNTEPVTVTAADSGTIESYNFLGFSNSAWLLLLGLIFFAFIATYYLEKHERTKSY